MAIEVITHNGTLPQNGGKRTGYLVDGLFIPIGGGPTLTQLCESIRAQREVAQAVAPVVEEPKKQIDVMVWDIQEPTWRGSCPRCGVPAYRIAIGTYLTNEGQMRLKQCSCGTFLSLL